MLHVIINSIIDLYNAKIILYFSLFFEIIGAHNRRKYKFKHTQYTSAVWSIGCPSVMYTVWNNNRQNLPFSVLLPSCTDQMLSLAGPRFLNKQWASVLTRTNAFVVTAVSPTVNPLGSEKKTFLVQSREIYSSLLKCS